MIPTVLHDTRRVLKKDDLNGRKFVDEIKSWLKHAPAEATLFPASYATFGAAMELTRNYKTTVCGGENRFVGIEVKPKWK